MTKKKPARKEEHMYMYDNVTEKDVYDTVKNLAVIAQRNIYTIKSACYNKRWCGKRYFFRKNQNEPVPEMNTPSSETRPESDYVIFKTYKEKFKEKKESALCLKSFIQIDSRTRVLFKR